MRYFYRSFLLLLVCQYVHSCKNFIIQQCTDIPIGFNSISTIKCIQLIPVQFDLTIDYSVENYIIQKTATCYNILSYNSSSSSTNLFSNECSEICSEQYCLLFDNQTKTSIINIFYSPSSIYELNKPLTNNISSYDYSLFDTCSSKNRKERTLLIIVYLLCGIVVILTTAVILQRIISGKLEKGRRVYDPYGWYWILDCLCCQIKSKTEHTNKPEKNSADSDSVEDNNQSGINRRNMVTTSTQLNMISNGSSNTINDQQNNGDFTSGSSSEPGYRGFSSGNTTLNTSRDVDAGYFHLSNDLENNNSSSERKNPRQSSVLPTLIKKLSHELNAALSVKSDTIQYTTLEAKPSPDIIYYRF